MGKGASMGYRQIVSSCSVLYHVDFRVPLSATWR